MGSDDSCDLIFGDSSLVVRHAVLRVTSSEKGPQVTVEPLDGPVTLNGEALQQEQPVLPRRPFSLARCSLPGRKPRPPETPPGRKWKTSSHARTGPPKPRVRTTPGPRQQRRQPPLPMPTMLAPPTKQRRSPWKKPRLRKEPPSRRAAPAAFCGRRASPLPWCCWACCP